MENSPQTPKEETRFMEGTAQDMLENMLEYNMVVIGVGGCGCNTVEYITRQEMKDVKTIGINTDKSIMGERDLDVQMLIGNEITDGNGANGDPVIGKRAAELNEEQIIKSIDGADVVVVVPGLGGGTGTGASKVVADLARRNSKLVVTYAIMPFSFEKERYERAQKHIEDISKYSGATIVFENDKAMNIAGGRSPAKAFETTNKMLHNLVKRLKMEYVKEFFHEIGLGVIEEFEDESQKLFPLEEGIKEEKIEEEICVEKQSEEPPVIEALKYAGESVEEDSSIMSLDSFLTSYPQ
ncbi:MAG: hypothetical protein R6U61_07835 [Thermoplasmata archaeon]